MKDDDLRALRGNALGYLDDPRRALEAERVLTAIDVEFKKRYLPGMIETFLAVFPGGFGDRQQLSQERDYKIAARDLCLELLSQSRFHALLEEKNWAELFDRAKQVVNKTNLIQGSFEKPKFLDAIKDPGNAPEYFKALYDVLWGCDSFYERFQRYCDVLEKMKLNKWTYATYFSFLADPENGMFVKPTVLKKSLEITRYGLDYAATPSAELYRQVLDFSKWLKAGIIKLRPNDLIDVQSFMWHMAPSGKWADE